MKVVIYKEFVIDVDSWGPDTKLPLDYEQGRELWEALDKVYGPRVTHTTHVQSTGSPWAYIPADKCKTLEVDDGTHCNT